MIVLYLFLWAIYGLWVSSGNKIFDLNGNFLNEYVNGNWLVLFYAPWCGHCREIEPTWIKLYNILHQSDINVARIDATMHRAVASHFDIQGFPTIIFITNKGKTQHTYTGARDIENILVFIDKVKGPPVRQISSVNHFEKLMNVHGNGVFFLHVRQPDQTDNHLKDAFAHVAKELYTTTYFYEMNANHLPMDYKNILKAPVQKQKALTNSSEVGSNFVLTDPVYFVFKDNRIYPYLTRNNLQQYCTTEDNTNLTDSELTQLCTTEPNNMVNVEDLYTWVRCQRFPSFFRLDWEIIDGAVWCHKLLIITYIQTYINNQVNPQHKSYYDMVEDIALNHKPKFDSKYWFTYTSDKDYISQLISSELDPPFILAYNLTDLSYFTFPTAKINFMNETTLIEKTPDNRLYRDFLDFLQFITDYHMLEANYTTQTFTIGTMHFDRKGGRSLTAKIYRQTFKIYKTIKDMFMAQPILSTIIFGLPIGLFSFVFWALISGSNSTHESSENEEELEHLEYDSDNYSSNTSTISTTSERENMMATALNYQHDYNSVREITNEIPISSDIRGDDVELDSNEHLRKRRNLPPNIK